jgi:hypothetical protein
MRSPTLIALAFVLAGIAAVAAGSARGAPDAGGLGAAVLVQEPTAPSLPRR